MKFEKVVVKFSELPMDKRTEKEHIVDYMIHKKDDKIEYILVTLETFRFFVPEHSYDRFIDIVETVGKDNVYVSIAKVTSKNPDYPYAKHIYFYYNNK